LSDDPTFIALLISKVDIETTPNDAHNNSLFGEWAIYLALSHIISQTQIVTRMWTLGWDKIW